MAPPDSVPRIRDSTELATEAARLGASGRVLLLQVGSESCVKCPAFGEAVASLAREYEFEWYYCDAHGDTDVPETHGISKLPAVVIVHDGASETAEKLDAASLRETVRGLCPRKRPADVNLFDSEF